MFAPIPVCGQFNRFTRVKAEEEIARNVRNVGSGYAPELEYAESQVRPVGPRVHPKGFQQSGLAAVVQACD